ncbi:hypothetical protein SAICODRAFT_30780, partial [Saitoella complicata NRRL Y-17804]|uniref:uncharacterized protein n=1 Tax=Saitoella complicata (strain BCRC 22490 / CBS 7301 / JCM 7358 / NBRC 10748 / NRRL Y-17804) TaxID=698492 RepID=UPI0008680F82
MRRYIKPAPLNIVSRTAPSSSSTARPTTHGYTSLVTPYTPAISTARSARSAHSPSSYYSTDIPLSAFIRSPLAPRTPLGYAGAAFGHAAPDESPTLGRHEPDPFCPINYRSTNEERRVPPSKVKPVTYRNTLRNGEIFGIPSTPAPGRLVAGTNGQSYGVGKFTERFTPSRPGSELGYEAGNAPMISNFNRAPTPAPTEGLPPVPPLKIKKPKVYKTHEEENAERRAKLKAGVTNLFSKFSGGPGQTHSHSGHAHADPLRDVMLEQQRLQEATHAGIYGMSKVEGMYKESKAAQRLKSKIKMIKPAEGRNMYGYF